MQNSEVVVPHLSSQTPCLASAQYQQTDSKNILLIEDKLGDVFLINWFLGQEVTLMFELTYVDSLTVAMQSLSREYFDVVLVDLELPDSQGIDTLLNIRRKYPNIPIVVLADSEDEALATQLLRYGAQDYLIKEKISQPWLKKTITLAIARSQWENQQHQHKQQLEQSNQVLKDEISDCKGELDSLRETLQNLSTIASTDGLTGIANRYCFEKYLEQEWLQAYQTQKPLSLIMIDLDYFKQYNDSCGHLQGDICLRQVAQSFHKRLKKPRKLIARYGGEEFVVVLPDTSIHEASSVARNLGWGIRALAIRHPSSVISSWVTASFGVASALPKSPISPAKLIDEADRALYLAKAKGRDLVAYFQLSSLVTQPISCAT